MKATAIGFLTALIAVSFACADWSIGYEFKYDYDTVYSNMREREHRDGEDLDDWIERGNATVTSSPVFSDGIRLTGWSTGFYSDKEDFDFGLASAIYYFDIPSGTQYIKVKAHYHGEGGRTEFDDTDEIAGRIWVRNYERERMKSYREDDDTLYGDTFLLRANRRTETIKIPAADHLRDGQMEVHIVVNDGMMLDLDYIVVESYRRMPEIKVVNRYYRVYDDRPWNHYTYLYFYDGPAYYLTDYGYYVRWVYPSYDRSYLRIRLTIGDHLGWYYSRYPRYHYYRRWSDIYVYDRYDRDVRYVVHRARVRPWDRNYDRIRRDYVVVRRSPDRERGRVATIRNRIRDTITSHRVRVEDTASSASRVRTTRPTDSRDTSRRTLRPNSRQDRANVITPRTEIRIRDRDRDNKEERTKRTTSDRDSSVRSRIGTRRQESPRDSRSSERQSRVRRESRERKEPEKEPEKKPEKKEDDEDEEDDNSRRKSIRRRIQR
jgi:hypothetical protein